MDQIDLDIISFLQSDGRIPFTDIAKALKVSEGTVRNRVSRLIDDRTLQIVGMVDPNRLGFDAPAVIGVSVQPPLLEKVVDTIDDPAGTFYRFSLPASIIRRTIV